jgi:curved DNA-binding protein CbpA
MKAEQTVRDLKFCPYEVLKLEPKATHADINKAFR